MKQLNKRSAPKENQMVVAATIATVGKTVMRSNWNELLVASCVLYRLLNLIAPNSQQPPVVKFNSINKEAHKN